MCGAAMWFRVEKKRNSVGQRFVVRCSGASVAEERPVRGTAPARRAAELLATSLNATATVYGTDAEGEFVYGVYEIAEGAAFAASPLIKRLYAKSAAASLSLRDQLLADIPEDAIRGFASIAAALGYLAAQHKQLKRSETTHVAYSTLFRIFCGSGEPSVVSLPADDATIALLTRMLVERPGWTCLTELKGAGAADRNAVIMSNQPNKVMLNIDGELQAIRPRTVFRGTVPQSGAQFMLIAQGGYNRHGGGWALDSVGLVCLEPHEADILALVRGLLLEANPFKNRVVLINRDLRTVRSRMSARTWDDIVPHEQARAELDFIAASIRDHEMLKAEGLSIKRGLLLSGPPGDGKSTAIECFVNDIAGRASVIIVEAVERIRAVYHLAQMLAPSVVILEDLDLMTKSAKILTRRSARTTLLANCCRCCPEAPLTRTSSRLRPRTIRKRSMTRSPSELAGSMRTSGWAILARRTSCAFSISISTVSLSTTSSPEGASSRRSLASWGGCNWCRRISKNLSKGA